MEHKKKEYIEGIEVTATEPRIKDGVKCTKEARHKTVKIIIEIRKLGVQGARHLLRRH